MIVHQLQLRSGSEAETRAIGAALAGVLVPGDVVGLTGDLGAGKTRLVQGAAEALGVTDPVISPTFMIVREHQGRVPVHHVDAYRLSGPTELEDLGLEDVLDPGAVVLVEWADQVARALPESWVEVRLVVGPDDVRHLTVEPHGPAWEGRVPVLERALAPFASHRTTGDAGR
ncbi:MAG TPA: tRNA (adenosine(37)-N6)-threonylcarbamoyltransferase complex ATPase subunit type 1 TsaE [Actinomycetes bacterium]|nr:tRNA (adenosine(37)-N6)-threonylcarbamoyltransferase complex ATPase subunit type 1 TsaE [Actinomycetes bacterium]